MAFPTGARPGSATAVVRPRTTAHDLVTYEGTDPEVMRNGLVAESHDYGDHLAPAAATGRLAGPAET